MLISPRSFSFDVERRRMLCHLAICIASAVPAMHAFMSACMTGELTRRMLKRRLRVFPQVKEDYTFAAFHRVNEHSMPRCEWNKTSEGRFGRYYSVRDECDLILSVPVHDTVVR